MNGKSNLWEKFRNKAYRKAFAADQLKRSVPLQIKMLRKAHDISQAELAIRSGLTQGVISRAESIDYGNLTFNTVIGIASGLDMAFIGKFIPFSELEREHESFSEDRIKSIRTFGEEDKNLASPDTQKPQADFREANRLSLKLIYENPNPAQGGLFTETLTVINGTNQSGLETFEGYSYGDNANTLASREANQHKEYSILNEAGAQS